MNPRQLVTLNQLFQSQVYGPARQVFHMAKSYELLALFFNREEGVDAEQCPFLKDEENVVKIRQAKKIIMERMNTPPTLKELSREIALNEYRLKEGFKNIYGKTVFQFLNDYRLDSARHLLDKGSVKVNDAAYHIGYTQPEPFYSGL
ncbi:MAG: AraC family transcriptional regulator [Owenweeksia sp.]|nr:AraC family transcriptional regulator [Owenweeksia sp.]